MNAMTQKMPGGVEQAALAMIAVLREENVALAAMDFARAGTMLAQKHGCADALAAAFQAAAPTVTADPSVLQDLATLAAENRRLLNQAMRVQRKVFELVARAARGAQPVKGYGARGNARGARSTGAAAFVTRA